MLVGVNYGQNTPENSSGVHGHTERYKKKRQYVMLLKRITYLNVKQSYHEYKKNRLS